ncbi:MAG: hypothetical protein KAI47_19410, partial [Deltaproteobacteria bacterium]|nr:hypothetical protein [Deltaproteobacteria bacterium]
MRCDCRFGGQARFPVIKPETGVGLCQPLLHGCDELLPRVQMVEILRRDEHPCGLGGVFVAGEFRSLSREVRELGRQELGHHPEDGEARGGEDAPD